MRQSHDGGGGWYWVCTFGGSYGNDFYIRMMVNNVVLQRWSLNPVSFELMLRETRRGKANGIMTQFS